MEPKILFERIWENHRGKFVGTLLGLVVGAAVLIFGFFKTVFVLLCGLIGLYVGKKIDDQEDLADIVERIVPPGLRR